MASGTPAWSSAHRPPSASVLAVVVGVVVAEAGDGRAADELGGGEVVPHQPAAELVAVEAEATGRAGHPAVGAADRFDDHLVRGERCAQTVVGAGIGRVGSGRDW